MRILLERVDHASFQRELGLDSFLFRGNYLIDETPDRRLFGYREKKILRSILFPSRHFLVTVMINRLIVKRLLNFIMEIF